MLAWGGDDADGGDNDDADDGDRRDEFATPVAALLGSALGAPSFIFDPSRGGAHAGIERADREKDVAAKGEPLSLSRSLISIPVEASERRGRK